MAVMNAEPSVRSRHVAQTLSPRQAEVVGLSITLGSNHANVAGLHKIEAAKPILRRNAYSRCLSSPFYVLPCYNNYQPARLNLTVVDCGTFLWA